MRKTITIFAAGLVLVGLILGSLGWAMGGRRSVKLDWFGRPFTVGSPVGERGEKHTDGAELGEITALDVDVSFADVQIKHGDRYAVELAWYGEEYELCYEYVNGSLRVWEKSEADNRWFLFGGVMDGGLVTVFLPDDSRKGEMAVHTALGDVAVNQLHCEALNISSDLGKVELDDIEAESMDICLSNGALTIARCQVGTASLTSSLGRISATELTSGGLRVKSNNGSVTLAERVLSEPVFAGRICPMAAVPTLARRKHSCGCAPCPETNPLPQKSPTASP